MKQMNLLTFLTKLTSKPLKSNGEEERNVQFVKSVSKQLSSEIENKENRNPLKQQRIGRIVTRLNTIGHCNDSKEENDDSELEAINDLANRLNLERKERLIMEAHVCFSLCYYCQVFLKQGI